MSAKDEPAMISPSSRLRFEVSPYSAEGGFTGAGLGMCLAATVAVALGLGYGASYLNAWLPKIEWLWAGLLAAAVAALGWVIVAKTKLRNSGVAFMVGLFGGLLAGVATYYWNYQRQAARLEHHVLHALSLHVAARQFPGGDRLTEAERLAIPPSIQSEIEPTIKEHEPHLLRRPTVQQALTELRNRRAPPKKPQEKRWLGERDWRAPAALPPEFNVEIHKAVREAVADFGFFGYLNWKATRGIAIAVPRVSKSLTFGFTGTVIFWSIELLIMGLTPAITYALRPGQPYCTECDTWKTSRVLGRLHLPGDQASALFTAGAVVDLAQAPGMTDDNNIQIRVSTCPRCLSEADIDVKVEEVTKDKKGNDQTSTLVHLTYPGPALRVLEALFEPVEPASRP